MNGYLPLLKQPVNIGKSNPRYRGLYRSPGWPTIDGEEINGQDSEALEAYIFGDYLDDTEGGLIPEKASASELLNKFGQSRNKFEMIRAETLDDTRAPDDAEVLLGYDIAGTAPFWSILADWPTKPGFDRFKAELNDNGPFSDPSVAERFLVKNRQLYPGDAKGLSLLKIWRVFAVPNR